MSICCSYRRKVAAASVLAAASFRVGILPEWPVPTQPVAAGRPLTAAVSHLAAAGNAAVELAAVAGADETVVAVAASSCSC